MSSWRDLCCMLNARFPQRSAVQRCCLYFQVTGRGYGNVDVGDGQRAEALALPCPACATSTSRR